MSTEGADPRFADIDGWPARDMARAILDGQARAVAVVEAAGEAIAAAAEAAAARLRNAGRIAYAGAGTSGRLAVQDGVELTPTYDWPGERLAFLLAGGEAAMTRGIEGAEDNAAAARDRVAKLALGANDVLVGVAASGRTPYTIAAIEAARGAGALTIAVANNAGTPLLDAAEHAIPIATGSEIVAGSTRMKAGTAQKAVLNCLSTAIMLRLGYVHRGLMVNMRASNVKLVARAERMVARRAGVDHDAAARAVALGGADVRRATLIARGLSPEVASALLDQHGGALHAALAAID